MENPLFHQPGLFSGKEWRVSSRPFVVEKKLANELEKLGHRLLLFYRACNLCYHQSAKGKMPEWICDYLDRGKPAALRELGLNPRFRNDLPAVIRPDLLMTEEGFAISELDSVPGGIGLTGWLNQTYAKRGFDVLGGAMGMVEGFHGILPHGADILVSEEASTYRPEMQWLAEQLNVHYPDQNYRVEPAESYVPREASEIYRFFELFDLDNIPSIGAIARSILTGSATITAPMKTYLEEKMWLALFWMPSLREFWRRELGERHWLVLQKCIPYGWIIDPRPLPHHAVFPKLNIQSWEQMANFTQKERELVLKISGFSETAWGSRGVTIGQDVSHMEWKRAVSDAIESFPHHPFVLQEFKKARIVEHPWHNPETGEEEIMRGRVRLCPYYFVIDGRAKLGGVLCTIVPADKKIIHGMRDAILVPAAVSA